MHAALQLPELLRVILACVPSKLPACLTCRLFSEVTLDFVWKDLPDISVFPFLTPLEYETTLNPDHPCYDAVLHMQHVERLKFYGRRVRGLTVVRDIQVTPAFLSCIARAGHDTPQSSTPSSPLTAILPQLTTLCPWSPAQDDEYDIRIEFRLRTFLLPSVTNLTLNFSARATDFAMMDALRCVRLMKCSLRSLELREILDEDSEFMALGPRQPGTMLVSQFADLVCNLPFLESLRIPLFLFNTVTVPTIGALAPLQHLGLDTFGQYSWDHSSIVPPQESGLAPFPALQSLSIAAPSDVIPLVLYPRTPIAAQISRLTLKCVFPNNKDSQVAFCKSAFAPPHGIQGLLTLEHLVITALVMYRTDLIPDSLGKEFFQPIFSSPFISRLVTFNIGYGFVLDIDDRDLEEMASLMPNLKSISLAPPLSRAVLESRNEMTSSNHFIEIEKSENVGVVRGHEVYARQAAVLEAAAIRFVVLKPLYS